MKKIKYITLILAVVGATFYLSSCTKDLKVTPLNPNIATSTKLFKNTATPYVEYLAKIYAGLSTGGIQGGDNQLDISGYDGGSQAGYLRPLWNLEELPTDEAMVCWNDGTIKNFHNIAWDPTDVFLNGFYARLYYQITIATSFLQQTTDAQLKARNCSQSLIDSIHTFRAQARFIRALCYDNVLDLFRNGPLVTDASPIGSSALPPYATAKQILDYITSELRSCQNNLIAPTVGYDQATYGQANKAAAWALLARVYLNANTYLGTSNTAYYDSTLMYCNKVIAAGYQLDPNYSNLFRPDNYKSKEIIFPNLYNANNLQTWGGLTFLECSMVDNKIQDLTGAPAGWGGNRAVPQLIDRFTEENNYQDDSRYGLLYQGFNHPSIDDNNQFEQGTPLLKFSNINSDGTKEPSASFVTGAFPLFRLGDVYLMYAEAVLRGGQGGTMAKALQYVNALQDRANKTSGSTSLEITQSQLTLKFILAERAREMFAEATRRTDLIRFGMFDSANYLWQWKGGVKSGKGFDSHWNVYPIPSTDMGANPNLKQNPGY